MTSTLILESDGVYSYSPLFFFQLFLFLFLFVPSPIGYFKLCGFIGLMV